MKKWNPVCILTVLVIGMVFMSGCTDTGSTSTVPGATPTPQTGNGTAAVTPTRTPTISPHPTPATGTVTSQTPQDPIIGSWLNGMVFNPDGTVGSDGTTIWKVNQNENNSYFVIADVPAEGSNNQRGVTSAEWIYNPYSDKINMRGSSQTFARGVKTTKPTTIPITTSRTPAIAVPVGLDDSPGSLLIHTGGLGGSEVIVFIAREGTSVRPIKNVYDTSGVIIESLAAGYLQVKIMPDGDSKQVSLAPGNYIAYLPDKYGNEPEQQTFAINANSNTVITFSGYSYRAASGGGCAG